MPKFEVGRHIYRVCLVAIAAAVIIALVALGAKDLLLRALEIFTTLLATTGLEDIAS